MDSDSLFPSLVLMILYYKRLFFKGPLLLSHHMGYLFRKNSLYLSGIWARCACCASALLFFLTWSEAMLWEKSLNLKKR